MITPINFHISLSGSRNMFEIGALLKVQKMQQKFWLKILHFEFINKEDIEILFWDIDEIVLESVQMILTKWTFIGTSSSSMCHLRQILHCNICYIIWKKTFDNFFCKVTTHTCLETMDEFILLLLCLHILHTCSLDINVISFILELYCILSLSTQWILDVDNLVLYMWKRIN